MGWRCSTCAHSIDGTRQGAQCNFYLLHIMHTWSMYCVRCICDFNTPPHCAARRALQRIRRKCCQREKEAQKSSELCEFQIQMTGQTRSLKVMYSALMDKCTMILCALLLVQLVDCLQVLTRYKSVCKWSGIMIHKFHVCQGIVASGYCSLGCLQS